MLKEKRQSLQTSFAVSFGILRKGTTEVWELLGFTHVTNSLATVTIRHLGVPQA